MKIYGEGDQPLYISLCKYILSSTFWESFQNRINGMPFRLIFEHSVYVDELKGSSEFSCMIHLSAFQWWFRVRVKLSFFLLFSNLSNTFDVPIQILCWQKVSSFALQRVFDHKSTVCDPAGVNQILFARLSPDFPHLLVEIRHLIVDVDAGAHHSGW